MTTNTHILWRHPKGQQQVGAPCSEIVDPGTETVYPLQGQGRSLVFEKCLPKKSMLKLVGDHSGERISCLNGVIWITQSGNPEDILVLSGKSFTIIQKGTIVVQGLVETRLKITSLGSTKSGWKFPSILL